MKTIAYLVYGDAIEYHLELTFSIASVVRFLKEDQSDIRIVIVTDKDQCRPDLPVEYIVYSKKEFDIWTNNGKYNHSAKINALSKVLQMSDGPVILLDTDTYFTEHPEKVFGKISYGNTVMHESEGKVGLMHEWIPLLKLSPSTIMEYTINEDCFMYNSGVIGVSSYNIKHLKDAIILTETLFNIKKLFNIEQFSVTNVLIKHTNVSLTKDMIVHYWKSQNRIFAHLLIRDLVPEFTEKAFQRLVESNVKIQIPKVSIIDKIISHVLSKIFKWDGNYKFAYIAYRASNSANSDVYKKAWYEVAKLFLRKSNYDINNIKRDFKNSKYYKYY